MTKFTDDPRPLIDPQKAATDFHFALLLNTLGLSPDSLPTDAALSNAADALNDLVVRSYFMVWLNITDGAAQQWGKDTYRNHMLVRLRELRQYKRNQNPDPW